MSFPNLENLPDGRILSSILNLVKKENQITSEVISHLEEIEARKLYSELKHKSLFYYCVNELRYSEDQAWRRINAMHLAKKVPAIKEKICSGTISLTNANLLSGFLGELKRSEIDDRSLSKREETKLLDRISNSSKRKCMQLLAREREVRGLGAISPGGSGKKNTRTIAKVETSQTMRLNVSIKNKTMAKIDRLKGIYAHQGQGSDLQEIIDKMADALLEKHQLSLVPKRQGKKIGKERYITKSVKFAALERANYKCEKCSSTHALQYEHIIPFAKGGKNDMDNIMVLCRNCNIRAGIREYGTDKMQRRSHKKVKGRVNTA